jgi:hypothetical protein
MSNNTRTDRKKDRQWDALTRRQEDLKNWEDGFFPADYVEKMTGRDEVVARKIDRAQTDIKRLERKLT